MTNHTTYTRLYMLGCLSILCQSFLSCQKSGGGAGGSTPPLPAPVSQSQSQASPPLPLIFNSGRGGTTWPKLLFVPFLTLWNRCSIPAWVGRVFRHLTHEGGSWSFQQAKMVSLPMLKFWSRACWCFERVPGFRPHGVVSIREVGAAYSLKRRPEIFLYSFAMSGHDQDTFK